MIIAPTLRVVALFWTLCVLLTTQSVENCIPTLERAERYFPTIVPARRALRSNSYVSPRSHTISLAMRTAAHEFDQEPLHQPVQIR